MIPQIRIASQQLVASSLATPEAVVKHMGAIQAQDYEGALWAIGSRLPGSTRADVERAIQQRTIVRTWPMRGTLHFVPAQDVRWMVELLTPRVITSAASRHRNLELDEATFTQARAIIEKSLQGGTQLSRSDLLKRLEENSIATAGQRGIHILWYWVQKGLICFAEHQGKQPSFALLDEWVPDQASPSREEAIALLARRYFASHGPATIQDFAWWSGLTQKDIKMGIEALGSELEELKDKSGTSHWYSRGTHPVASHSLLLLAPYEEYLLGYKDRSMVLDREHAHHVTPGFNGVFGRIIVKDGMVIGTWSRQVRKNTLLIDLKTFLPDENISERELAAAKGRFEHFLGL